MLLNQSRYEIMMWPMMAVLRVMECSQIWKILKIELIKTRSGLANRQGEIRVRHDS